MKTTRFLLLALVTATLAISCKKDDATPASVSKVSTGLYVLSEGLFNNNNTTLTYYKFSTNAATTDFYAGVNSSSLGDTGNDMIIYGGKMYIVVNVSSYLEVDDALTAKSLKKIDFKTAASAPRQPRYVVEQPVGEYQSHERRNAAQLDEGFRRVRG